MVGYPVALISGLGLGIRGSMFWGQEGVKVSGLARHRAGSSQRMISAHKCAFGLPFNGCHGSFSLQCRKL